MADNQQEQNGTATRSTINPLPKPVKGKADWRSYRSFQLENGVTCTVVHDKESKMISAAAVVDAGAGADPRSLSGTAHFCEHMLFLGSEAYPGENEYKSFLASHGGRSNASTSLHTTTYKFEVLADYGEKAFDIFSNFFIAPLFSPSGVSREVQAVDSENSKNLTNDARRRLQILKALADENHYFSKFSTGNANTLPTLDGEQLERIRSALLAFHRKHYRPENIAVVVAGPQSLDALQDWVVSRFSKVEAWSFPEDVEKMTPIEREIHEAAKDAPNYAYHKPTPPYHPAFLPSLQGGWPVLLTTKPLKSYRKLTLMFQLPSDRRDPDRSPIHVLSHLLGHEGPGSAFAILQDHGLISNLVAGPRVSGPDFCLFNVEMNLTKEGEDRWKEVADIIFAHCRLIHNAATEAKRGNSSELHRIWGEVAALRAIFFDQNSPGGVYEFAPNLVGSILVNGTEKCLSSGSMLEENMETFPLEQIVDFGSRLVPSNCIIERCSQDAWDEMVTKLKEGKSGTTKRTEQWYGVDYYLSKIDSEDVSRWEGAKPSQSDHVDRSLLHLPKPNRYIPRTLELCPELPEEAKLGPRIEKEIDPPNLILQNSVGRLWHRLDDRYALPKSSLTLLVRNAAVENVVKDGMWQYEVHSSVHSSLLAGMFAEAMAQDTYDADLAGLHWSLAMTSSGIKLTCNGFSDRLSDLALTVLKEFFNGSFLREHYFNDAKDRMIRNLSNYFESRRSDSIAIYYRDLLISSNEFGIDKSLETARAISLHSAREQHQRLIQNSEASIDCLYSGNVSKTKAENFFNEASKLVQQAQLPANSNSLEDRRVWIPGPLEHRLPPGDTELHFPSNNPSEENGAVLVTFQSSTPGFRGGSLSSMESLQSTAAIRLLSHMLREPCFDELRTKQQLGYIVHSYYDLSFSTPRPNEYDYFLGTTTPVDFLVISILSRKVSPLEVAKRIDSFLEDFRETLSNMPNSTIADYAAALQTKLLKPIQKLSDETNNHFGKIRRFGPEILAQGGNDKDLPWDNAKVLAQAIGKLERTDLIATWDRLVQDRSRARIVSHVYGSTHPLDRTSIQISRSRRITDTPNLIKLRKQLSRYSASAKNKSFRTLPSFFNNSLPSSKIVAGVATVAAAIGVGYIGLTVLSRSKKLGK